MFIQFQASMFFRQSPGIFKKIISIPRALAISLLISIPTASWGQNSQPDTDYDTSVDFETPNRLKPRVKFWKDIFSKYGAGHFVVHHRMYPQIVFSVVDITSEFETLNPVAFAGFKSDAEMAETERIKQIITFLAAGNSPSDSLSRSIAKAMSYLGNGTDKYQQVIEEDLIRTQSGIRERHAEALKRSGRHLPMMEKIFRQNGLPTELTRLPFIESSFDYTAYSSVGAAGIWQFMRATAKSYMTVTSLVDYRRDPEHSTRAAAQYLKGAYRRLGKWPLAITSYNHGITGVARKVQELGTDDISDIVEHRSLRPLGFASNNFYPEFLAAVEVYRERTKLFPEVRLDPPIFYSETRLPRETGARETASTFGLDLEKLRSVNYALSEDIWKGRYKIPAGFMLRIPSSGNASSSTFVFSDLEPRISTIHGSFLTHIVRPNETLRSIAIHYGVTVDSLRDLNQLESDLLEPGAEIFVKNSQGKRALPATIKNQPLFSKRTAPLRRGSLNSSLALKRPKSGKPTPTSKKIASKKKPAKGKVLLSNKPIKNPANKNPLNKKPKLMR